MSTNGVDGIQCFGITNPAAPVLGTLLQFKPFLNVRGVTFIPGTNFGAILGFACRDDHVGGSPLARRNRHCPWRVLAPVPLQRVCEWPEPAGMDAAALDEHTLAWSTPSTAAARRT